MDAPNLRGVGANFAICTPDVTSRSSKVPLSLACVVAHVASIHFSERVLQLRDVTSGVQNNPDCGRKILFWLFIKYIHGRIGVSG